MAQATSITGALGAVVIGRNEGPRLDRCLGSMASLRGRVVYVDSGSTDDSLEIAARHGVAVVELDMSIPFTAARARNAGFHRLREVSPDVSLVQFVDGDCEMIDGWLETAEKHILGHEEICAVSGRVREKFPEQSVYNYLCDFEWNTPIGIAKHFGGNVMLRAEALADVDGYREDLIAGEEPELAVRLRSEGWVIERLDFDMVWHDAALTRFGQWWKRTLRAGFAYAQGAYLHGRRPERHFVTQMLSALVWGAVIPLGLILCGLANPVCLLGFLIYPLQVMRIWRRSRSLKYAFFIVLGKFPESIGIIGFWSDLAFGKKRGLIEHK